MNMFQLYQHIYAISRLRGFLMFCHYLDGHVIDIFITVEKKFLL